MNPVSKLPFKVGQLAESRTFLSGYRGAWFRCKIKKIDLRGGRKRLCLEYFDFPDEKEGWTVLYQKIPCGKVNQGEMQLMVRPCYPPLFKGKQIPDLCKISETTLIVNDAWRVDDLVDWWCDNCYWSGRVAQLLGDDKVQVALLGPPSGEGGLYEALCVDLRPSLDWSVEHGWNVPVSEVNGNETASPCARLVQPSMQNKENTVDGDPVENCNIGGDPVENCNVGGDPEENSNIGGDPVENCNVGGDPEENSNIGEDPVENNINRRSGFGNSSSSEVSKDNGTGNCCQQNYLDLSQRKQNDVDASSCASKRMKVSENAQVAPTATFDAIDSAIMELEEIANKVKWLKNVLKFGFGWSNAMKPSWKFIENNKPSRRGCE